MLIHYFYIAWNIIQNKYIPFKLIVSFNFSIQITKIEEKIDR